MAYQLPEIDGQPTVDEIKDYLLNAIDSFKDDPADSDFQRGFLAAAETIYSDLFLTKEERAGER